MGMFKIWFGYIHAIIYCSWILNFVKSDVCPEQKEKLSNINSKSNGFSSGDHLNIPGTIFSKNCEFMNIVIGN